MDSVKFGNLRKYGLVNFKNKRRLDNARSGFDGGFSFICSGGCVSVDFYIQQQGFGSVFLQVSSSVSTSISATSNGADLIKNPGCWSGDP